MYTNSYVQHLLPSKKELIHTLMFDFAYMVGTPCQFQDDDLNNSLQGQGIMV